MHGRPARARLVLHTCLVGLALALASPSGAQQGGTIRGRVQVHLPVARIGHHPDASALASQPARKPLERGRAVVYLETAPRAAFEDQRGRRARIDQRDETFVPHVLAITVGTTVDFPNNDVTYHNVFSLSPSRVFDLGRYKAGRSRAVTFDRPGIVRVFCDIHSHMSAFILVFSHRFFAVTDEEGRYRIDDVPPGTYTVRAWNEAVDGDARIVTVAPGAETDVSFVLGRGER